MKDNFKIITNFKWLISYLDKIILNFPSNEKVLKDKISITLFDTLELIYYTNEVDDRKNLQKKIIAKMKMIDYYFKISLNKRYISYKKYNKISMHLLNILKQLYGWIKYEKVQ